MIPQSFLNGLRATSGMGVQNTRGSVQRSDDQNMTQSGNPNGVYNMLQRTQQPQQTAYPQSWNAMQPGGGYTQLAPTQGGIPGRNVNMPANIPPMTQPGINGQSTAWTGIGNTQPGINGQPMTIPSMNYPQLQPGIGAGPAQQMPAQQPMQQQQQQALGTYQPRFGYIRPQPVMVS